MLYTFTLNGFYPVGACGYVVAKDIEKAFALVKLELSKSSLGEINKGLSKADLREVDMTREHVAIILDGNY